MVKRGGEPELRGEDHELTDYMPTHSRLHAHTQQITCPDTADYMPRHTCPDTHAPTHMPRHSKECKLMTDTQEASHTQLRVAKEPVHERVLVHIARGESGEGVGEMGEGKA